MGSLSKESVKKLEVYVDDDNVDVVIPYIKKGIKQIQTTGQKYKEYFKRKGLANCDFDENANLGIRIAEIFNDNEATELFNTIIDNNGLLNFADIINRDKILNIYEVVLENIKNKFYVTDIDDIVVKKIITDISDINNVTSNGANVGKYEVLLKFILIQDKGKNMEKGDVVITYNNEDESIEVKTGNKLQTSAHPCGQGVRTNAELTHYFAALYDKDVGDKILFGSATCNGKLLEFIGWSINDIDIFISNIVKTISYQYFLEDNVTFVNDLTNAVMCWNNETNCINSTLSDAKTFNNLIGCLQTICYNKHDRWNSICIVNTTNGNFRIEHFDNDITKETIINIMNKFTFYPSEGNKNATGRRSISRIFI